MIGNLRVGGILQIKHIRNGRQIAKYRKHNDVTDSGLQYICRTMFQAGTYSPYKDWYMGLIDSAAYSGVANDDLMPIHTGWAEFEDYSEAARQAWVPTLLSSPATFSNASACEFTIDAAGDVKGMFIASDDTLGGTAGFLWATAVFGSAIEVLNADVFRCQYELTASR